MQHQRRVRVQSARSGTAREQEANNTVLATGPAAYERVRPLGEGSFGKVFLVKHRGTGAHEVMKEVLLRGLNPKSMQRTKDEVRFLKRLHHPHLISYRASFLEDSTSTLYILMEHADGGDLKSRIEKQAAPNVVAGVASSSRANPFAEALVLKWLVQCVSALAFCHHDLKLLHRDSAPAALSVIRICKKGQTQPSPAKLRQALPHSAGRCRRKAADAHLRASFTLTFHVSHPQSSPPTSFSRSPTTSRSETLDFQRRSLPPICKRTHASGPRCTCRQSFAKGGRMTAAPTSGRSGAPSTKCARCARRGSTWQAKA